MMLAVTTQPLGHLGQGNPTKTLFLSSIAYLNPDCHIGGGGLS